MNSFCRGRVSRPAVQINRYGGRIQDSPLQNVSRGTIFKDVLYLKKIKITFKLLALLTVIVFSIYRVAAASKVAGLDEISNYSAPEIFEMVNGVYHENLAEKWGEPDGTLSGFWGDFWNIGNNKQIIVYYDSDGCVNNVKIDNIEADNNE